ncbi:hypothetical protein ARMSODRAFT_1018962 [Armillaria solidipes]|uniref:F-box domain-containing protein n=1 Tax=Armillaria solidipes TaxID=1076256 RepID=A0A2H3BFG0_9AGAR|nr:hypothetical protein ARMSODRAFT_1018962 [Armillaria solidipes]
MDPSRIPLEAIFAKYDWISTFTHPPDIASLLCTNDAPSPLQATQLKTSLEGLKGPLTELESDLDLLHDAIASLETQMLRLQSLKHDYETALSPIRRIPLEITIEIIRRSWKNSLSGFHVFRILEGPWYLGQVCSSWRNVIEKHCPELWATMVVGSFSYEGKVAKKSDRVEMLRIVLERSRNHPLNFRFDYDLAVKEGEPDVMGKCLDIMVAHSKRWRAVEMTILPSLFPRLSLIHGKIDWLADMDLSCSGVPQSGDIGAFEVAPKLEKLHLSYLHPEASIRFPVTSLVSFSDVRAFAGDKLTPEYLNVVELAPKLRSFSYNDHSDYSIHNQMTTPLSFPRVMSRSLIELSTSSPNFLRSMELPSLKEFTLTTMCGADLGEKVIKCPARALRALHEMLLRSQCSLTQLHLIDPVLDNNLANIIRLVPSLQELVIEFYEWVDGYDPIMQSLVTQLSEVSLVNGSFQHCMVPNLQKLGVNLLDLSHPRIYFINSAFVDMVASRLHPPSDTQRLTKLQLWMEQGRHDLDEAAKNALMSLRDDGLELDLSSDKLDEDPMFE